MSGAGPTGVDTDSAEGLRPGRPGTEGEKDGRDQAAELAVAAAAQGAWWAAAVAPPIVAGGGDPSPRAARDGSSDAIGSSAGSAGGRVPGGTLMALLDLTDAKASLAVTMASPDGSTPGAAAVPTSGATAAPGMDASNVALMMRMPSAGGGVAVERFIGVPVADASWQNAVAAQVHWMAGAGVQSATLKLTPEHLGPVEVRIDLQSSQINVSFIAPHPETRSALEQSVATLRTMLAHGGLTLGQASVQSESRPGSHFAAPRTGGAAPAGTAEPAISAVAVRVGLGLVDEYA